MLEQHEGHLAATLVPRPGNGLGQRRAGGLADAEQIEHDAVVDPKMMNFADAAVGGMMVEVVMVDVVAVFGWVAGVATGAGAMAEPLLIHAVKSEVVMAAVGTVDVVKVVVAFAEIVMVGVAMVVVVTVTVDSVVAVIGYSKLQAS